MRLKNKSKREKEDEIPANNELIDVTTKSRTCLD